MHRRILVATTAFAILTSACAAKTGTTASPSAAPGAGGYHPNIVAANFSAVVDNPWFPLKPGSRYVYQGTKDGEPSRDVFEVLSGTKVIDGVACAMVHDRLYLSGKLHEETTDYYTQDRQGNVWYFGEDTEELDANGHVTSREGSWMSGQDGAEPGIFIAADPAVGVGFRQEYYAGHAEDRYAVVDVATPVSVPYGSFGDALLTKEWTALEPDVLDHKYYVKGIGEVAELSVKGPVERNRLVSFTAG